MRSTEELAHSARDLVLATSARTSTPHLSSSLSVLDILVCLGADLPTENGGAREIYLSKGHASLGMYASMVALGKLPAEVLDTYCSDGSFFEGHVNSKIPGIPLSTGSLGHAAAFAAGRAIGDLRSGSDRQHWVVLSDGELDEGSNWEAFLIASHRKLPNIHFAIDRNGVQSLGSTEETSSLEPLGSKLSAFGLKVLEVDGHNHDNLKQAISDSESEGAPTVMIAHTTKGFGLKEIEESAVLYHYKPATQALVDQFRSQNGAAS
jgi:transketolase